MGKSSAQSIAKGFLDVPVIHPDGRRSQREIMQKKYKKLIRDDPLYTVWRHNEDTNESVYPQYLVREKWSRRNATKYTLVISKMQLLTLVKEIINRYKYKDVQVKNEEDGKSGVYGKRREYYK